MTKFVRVEGEDRWVNLDTLRGIRISPVTERDPNAEDNEWGERPYRDTGQFHIIGYRENEYFIIKTTSSIEEAKDFIRKNFSLI